QGELIKLLLANFYAFMTLHGLGMAGVLFSMVFAALWYLIGTRFVRLNLRLGYFVYFTILIGLAGLTISTLIGKFGTGWYMLYPLPFKDPTWVSWSIRASLISIIILGMAWLVGILHLLLALSKEYRGFTNLLGWQYLRKHGEREELPPIVLITTISLTSGILGFLTGIAMMSMYLFQSFESALSFDPLLLKNMTFFFVHTLVNITLYCSVGWVYALLPEFTGREWKTNKMLMYAWNATFFFILFTYFHHLYMDFVQPIPMQYAGQIASYLSAIPATAITMFGIIVQFYHSKIKWSIIPLMFLLGMAGWAIGGFAALVNSTISVNKVLHNTLWVPAHFHTYTLMGIVLFIFAFLFYLFSTKDKRQVDKIAKTGLWLFIAGGYGFLLMFYLGGLSSIPRTYARYTGINIKGMHDKAVYLAQISVLFIILLLTGLLITYFSLFSKLCSHRRNSNLS
ncbi:MAG TPA: cbb3-type cytochrome c oxidase subunit I, partial [Hanamia sp.]|nr:cbb3-type cytochrome c oxidase subunit I [Hanamia sp.]